MKKLYKIKVEYETYKVSEDEDEALYDFWDSIKQAEEVGEDFLMDFLNNIVVVEEITDAEELLRGWKQWI